MQETKIYRKQILLGYEKCKRSIKLQTDGSFVFSQKNHNNYLKVGLD